MSLEVAMRKYFLLFLLLYNTCISTKLTEANIPLLGAARLGSKKLTYQALCKGANPNATDELGNSPLHYAVHLGSKSITELLLCHHADPNIKNNKGKTPFDIAVQSENNYIIRRLILYGAQPQDQQIQQEAVNILTKKYIQCAKTTNLVKLQQLGSYRTINKNAQIGKHKRTALMYAARNNRTAIASYLVNSMQVDSTIKDAYGNTARDYAKKHNNPKLLEMLS